MVESRLNFEKKKYKKHINIYAFVYILRSKIYFANFLCFAFLFAHLSSILNNFNCNDENWILGGINHTDMLAC